MLLTQNPFRCCHSHSAAIPSPHTTTTRTRRRRRRNHLHLNLLHAHFQFPSICKPHHTPPSPSPLFQLRAVRGTDIDHHSGLVICADDPIIHEDQEQHDSMTSLPVNICSVRELGACLTIKEGYAKLKEALQNEKLSASLNTSAVIQYRVLVPPSAKALDWFCSQKTALPIYPHCYFSSSHQQLDGFLKFSSFGHAICIHGSGSNHKGYHLLSRYLSPDTLTVRAYGFNGINTCKDISVQGEENDLFYLYIPQIELRELDGCSVLAATLIWDDVFSLSFERAVYLLESCLDQVGHNISSKNIYERERWMSNNCAKENVLEGGISHLVCMNGGILSEITNTQDGCMQKVSSLL